MNRGTEVEECSRRGTREQSLCARGGTVHSRKHRGEEQVPGEVPGSTPPGLGLAGVMRIWVFIQREEWKALERLYSGEGKVRGSG